VLAYDELIVINHDKSREGEYIRIRVILLGESTFGITVDHTLHDVKVYRVTQKKEMNRNRIEQFIDDADIVIFVADGGDGFAVENICRITEILDRNGVLHVKIIDNEKSFPLCRDKNGDTLVSNVLIVEDQEDNWSDAEISTVNKMEKLLNTLCQIIDNEINTYRMHEYDCSALITLESFFEEKGELNIYMNYSYEQLDKSLKDGTILQSQLEQASKVWMKFDSTEKSSQTIMDCIELIEENVDEDADVYFSSDEGA